jgi:putative membrane protein
MNENKSMSIHYFLRGAILFAFALFIVLLVKSDSLVYYIAPRMVIYVKLSAMGLYAISVYQIYLGIRALSGKAGAACDCQHPPSSSIIKNFVVYGLFIFPLLLGFLLPNTVMGSAFAAKKGMNLNSANSIRTTETSEADQPSPDPAYSLQDTQQEIASNESDSSEISDEELEKLFDYDIFTEFYAKFGMQLYKQDLITIQEDIYIETLTTLDLFLDTFVGKKVQLSGFVYREDGMNEQQFVVGRFALQCCSADAAPYGVMVEYDNAQNIADDEWVTVTGTLTKTTFNDYEIMKIDVENVISIEEPDSPYVYPNYDFGFE